MIGRNRYWMRSRVSHLDRLPDQLHFAVKKLQTKCKHIDYFLLTIFIYGSAIRLMTEKGIGNQQTLVELSLAHRRLQAKCQQKS